MRKTWVKRENIYYKPFYKQKSKMFLLFIFLLAILFFFYQVSSVNNLPNTSTPNNQENYWSFENLKRKHKQMQLYMGKSARQSDTDDGGGGNVNEDYKSYKDQDGIKIIRYLFKLAYKIYYFIVFLEAYAFLIMMNTSPILRVTFVVWMVPNKFPLLNSMTIFVIVSVMAVMNQVQMLVPMDVSIVNIKNAT